MWETAKLLWKAYCIASDFAWSLLNFEHLTTILTISIEIFKHFANNFDRYPFGTLLVATSFNPEPIDFIIEGDIGKVFRIGTILSKTENSLGFLTNLLSI